MYEEKIANALFRLLKRVEEGAKRRVSSECAASEPLTTSIGGILTAVTNDHDNNFGYWRGLGMEKATLFHIDAHPDMSSGAKYNGPLTLGNCSDFGIANFICPAVYHDIVDSIYWLNPHSHLRRLQDLGTVRSEFGRKKLKAQIEEKQTGLPVYAWVTDTHHESMDLVYGYGKIITPQKIYHPANLPLIMDIDLDAFCCHKGVYYAPISYNGTFCFEQRVEDAINVLRTLPRPDLITITRSQGDYYEDCFVPPNKVDRVQDCLIENLRRIYSK